MWKTMGLIGDLWRRLVGPDRVNRRSAAAAVSLDDIFANLDAGAESASGIPIDIDSSLSIAAFFRAVTLISRDVARAAIHVYRMDDQGNREPDDFDQIAFLIRVRPNPFTSAYDFFRGLVASAMTAGNGYAYIQRTEGLGVAGMYLLDSSTVDVHQGDFSRPPSYRVRAQSTGDGAIGAVRWEDMLHLKGPILSSTGVVGIDVVNKARDTLGLCRASDVFTSKFFSNGAMPRGYVSVAGTLNDDGYRNLKKVWNKSQGEADDLSEYGGLTNAFKMAVLDQGAKIESLGVNPKDALLDKLKSMTVIDVANFTGVPPHKLGDSSKVSYNSLGEENQDYDDETLDPWFRALETELNCKLMDESDLRNRRRFIEFQRQSLLRMDIDSRYQAYERGIRSGFILRSEARRWENLPPVEGIDDGAAPPAGNSSSSMSDDPTQPAEPDDDDDDPERIDGRNLLRRVAFDALRRIAKRLASRAAKAADLDDYGAVINQLARASVIEEISREIAPVQEAIAGLAGVDRAAAPILIREVMAALREAAVAGFNATLRDRVVDETPLRAAQATVEELFRRSTNE